MWSLGAGASNSSYLYRIRLQKALSCIDRSYWIQKLHALKKNTGFYMKFYPVSAMVVQEQ